jgi:hypothetical protein
VVDILLTNSAEGDIQSATGVAAYLASSFQSFNWLYEQVETWAEVNITQTDYSMFSIFRFNTEGVTIRLFLTTIKRYTTCDSPEITEFSKFILNTSVSVLFKYSLHDFK